MSSHKQSVLYLEAQMCVNRQCHGEKLPADTNFLKVLVRLNFDVRTGVLRIDSSAELSLAMPFNFIFENCIPASLIDDIYISVKDIGRIYELPSCLPLSKLLVQIGNKEVTNESIRQALSHSLSDVENIRSVFLLLKDFRLVTLSCLQTADDREVVKEFCCCLLERMHSDATRRFDSPRRASPRRSKGSNSSSDSALEVDSSLKLENYVLPFDTKAEWMHELATVGVIGSMVPLDRLILHQNPNRANATSAYYLAPARLASTVWLYTHRNGSMMLLAGSGVRVGQPDLPVVSFDLSLFNLPDFSCARRWFDSLKVLLVQSRLPRSSTLPKLSLTVDCNGEVVRWRTAVSACLNVVGQVVKACSALGEPRYVVLHSNDRSWILVIAALAQLCLCAELRTTLASFNRMVQKTFVSLGFCFRIEHSPNVLFVLFLDCVFQLMCQNPSSFGISPAYISAMALADLSNLPFYEFAIASPIQRARALMGNHSELRSFFRLSDTFHANILAKFQCNVTISDSKHNYNRHASTPGDVGSGVKPSFQKLQPRASERSPVADSKPLTRPVHYGPFRENSGKFDTKYRSNSSGNLLSSPSSSKSTIRQLWNRLTAATKPSFGSNTDLDDEGETSNNFEMVACRPQRGQHKRRNISASGRSLVLQIAPRRGPLKPPVSYFDSTSSIIRNSSAVVTSDKTVIFPRFQLPCIRVFDFFLASDFAHFIEKDMPVESSFAILQTLLRK